jgi:hypothetical protein
MGVLGAPQPTGAFRSFKKKKADITGPSVRHYIEMCPRREEMWWAKFRGPSDYANKVIYVTKEDHAKLLAKYASNPQQQDGEYVLLDRARAISDWPS